MRTAWNEPTVKVQTQYGATSTPSTAAGTRANDEFNALIRKGEAQAAEQARKAAVAKTEKAVSVLTQVFEPTLEESAGYYARLAVLRLLEEGYDL